MQKKIDKTLEAQLESAEENTIFEHVIIQYKPKNAPLKTKEEFMQEQEQFYTDRQITFTSLSIIATISCAPRKNDIYALVENPGVYFISQVGGHLNLREQEVM